MNNADDDFTSRCQPEILTVLRYWQSKCRGRVMPSRGDIDPADLVDFIPSMVIVEVAMSGERPDYIYRLVGSREVAARGRDPTGGSVARDFFGRFRDRALRKYDLVTELKTPQFHATRYTTKEGLLRDDEELFLPLSEDGETVNRILVYVVTRLVPLRQQRP